VGTYNPRTTPASLTLKRDRIDYWVGNGALLSDRVAKLYAVPIPAPAAEPVAAPVPAPAAEPVAEPIAPSIAALDAEPAPAA
jgi:hypothetical protein